MVRCQSIAWSILIWSIVFLYTWLTYIDSKPIYQTIVIGSLFPIILVLSVLVLKAVKKTKTLLLFTGWCFFVNIGVFLKTLDVINDWHLNLLVAIFTGLSSILWCVISHTEHVTESGYHWYVWSVISILTMCSAFNNDSQTAIVIYIINAAVLSLTQILYIWHVYNIQTSGRRRCKHIFRLLSCFSVIMFILVGSICYKTKEISEFEWQEWILIVEIILFVILIIDGLLGFTHSRINGDYEEASTDDLDNV